VTFAGHLCATRGECVQHLNRRRLEGRGLIAARVRDAQARIGEHPALKRTGVLNAEVRRGVRGVIRTLGLVVRADAQVVCRVVQLIERQANRLIFRQRVVEQSLDVEVVSRRPEVERLCYRAGGLDDVEIGSRVRRVALQREREGALLARERPANDEDTDLHVLGPLDRRERRVARQRPGTHAVLGLAAQRAQARLRDDVDEEGARVVVLGREAVARDVDRFDLRLRRQRRALETVDADDRRTARHLGELLAQDGRVVGQRLDLLTCQRRPERGRAVDGDFLPIARDVHGVGELLNRQRYRFFILAGAHAHVGVHTGLETGRLGFDCVAARPEPTKRRHSLRICRHRLHQHRLHRLVLTGDGDDGARQHAAGLIHDGDRQAPVTRLRDGLRR